MGLFLKLFNTTAEYNTYTADTSNFILPNVSFCTTEGDVHYNPYVEPETRVVATFNVTDTSSPTKIGYNQYISGFSEIEIDGVAQPSVVSAYTFDTIGEHTVKYTLKNAYSLPGRAFEDCSGLTSIYTPSIVTDFSYGTFSGCKNLTRVNSNFDGVFNLPSRMASISENLFETCYGLTSVTIPDSVTIIRNGAFDYCSNLISVTIGSGVTSIGNNAFRSNINLEVIISRAMSAPSFTYAPDGYKGTFASVKPGGTLYIPQGATGYNAWLAGDSNLYQWTMVEQ